MNTPAEPEGGKKGHGDIKITLLSSSGNPWTNGLIEHNWKKYSIGKDGSVMLAVNGGEIYANEHAVTRIVREQIQLGISHIILQHDMQTGSIRLKEKIKSSTN